MFPVRTDHAAPISNESSNRWRPSETSAQPATLFFPLTTVHKRARRHTDLPALISRVERYELRAQSRWKAFFENHAYGFIEMLFTHPDDLIFMASGLNHEDAKRSCRASSAISKRLNW